MFLASSSASRSHKHSILFFCSSITSYLLGVFHLALFFILIGSNPFDYLAYSFKILLCFCVTPLHKNAFCIVSDSRRSPLANATTTLDLVQPSHRRHDQNWIQFDPPHRTKTRSCSRRRGYTELSSNRSCFISRRDPVSAVSSVGWATFLLPYR